MTRKEYLRKQYLANRDKWLARSRQRYEANKELIRGQAKYRYETDLIGVMLDRARQRARRKGLPFNIERGDVIIPILCPILGLPLHRNKGGRPSPNSPSLDRIDSLKGYVKGNVQVISYLANQMKSNASPEMLLKFAKYVTKTYHARSQNSNPN